MSSEIQPSELYPSQVFDGAFRTKMLMPSLWMPLGCALLPISKAMVGPTGFWYLLVSFFAGCFAAIFRRQSLLQRQMARKISLRDGSDPAGLPFVGVDFGVAKRKYQGDSDWDVGFLSSDGRGIYFHGDLSSWHISWQRIVQVDQVPFYRGRSAEGRENLLWRDDDGTERLLCFSSRETVGPLDARVRHERIRLLLSGAIVPFPGARPTGRPPFADRDIAPAQLAESAAP